MKEIIEMAKDKNSNEKYNSKDLLWYLVGKIDKIEEKIDTMNIKVNTNTNYIKYLAGAIIILGSGVAFLFKVIYNIKI